ncbi:MAG: outer membrane protein assembly factor BamA [Spirochaetaceae bacterium]|jgi:outer membrane protein insertion porin family|nr:outer membrane protein assembly factor BamA [Spirochaetaceae bacterium]
MRGSLGLAQRLGFVRAAVCILLTAGSVFAQESGEWYLDKPIRNVIFEGLNHVKKSELDGVIEPFLGRAFSDEVFWELQGRIYALEYFETIAPSAVPADSTGTEVVIRFVVTERPTVSRINFVGNSGLRRSELLDAITIKVNDVANQLKLKADETALANKYLEKGYPDIRIRSETQEGRDGTIIVTFFVTEGDKVTISALNFEGNAVFSDRALRGRLSLKIKGLLNDGAFQEAKLVADRAAVTQYYHDRGYIDAEVTDVIRDAHKDEKGNNVMSVTFRIYEGRIYNFGGVTFEGNRIFSTEQLGDLIYSRPGDTVNARRVEADMQRVADLYYENGYIFNTITPEPRRDPEAGSISYHITIVEQGRAHIERILVVGNNKTKDAVILREIPLEPGDIFSKTKVLEGMRNLYNLQYFSMVAPDTLPGSTGNLMDLVFNVEEQLTTDIQLGITWSGSTDPDAFPLSGLFKFTDRNFFGYGNMVSGEINANQDTQTLSLSYTQRWIFGLPLSGGFDFTFQHTKRLAFMSNGLFNGDEDDAYPAGFTSYDDYVSRNKTPAREYLMSYDQLSFSLGFSTGYRWLTGLGNLGLNGGIRTGWIQNKYDDSLQMAFDPVLRDRNSRFVPALSFWAAVSLDQRDIYYDPSRGYYGIQRVGYYGILPIEREHYFRTDTKAEVFFTLLNLPITDTYSFKTVFGVHGGVSFILPQPGRQSPEIENANKLSVDGMFTGRGWSGERTNRGNALLESWAELRFPFFPGILSLDLFFDAAAKTQTPYDFFHNFTAEDLRFSFGFGPRLSIPQFPLKLQFARRFRIEDGGVKWEKGAIGIFDLVVSFTLATY